MGFSLVPVKNLSDPVEPDKVGYIFSDDDLNTIFWVLRGYAAAGAVDNQHFFNETGKSRESLRIVYETLSIPRQIVSYRADLSPELVKRIKDLLIQMEQMKEGKKVLEQFSQTTRFDELSDNDHALLEKLQSFLGTQCELK